MDEFFSKLPLIINTLVLIYTIALMTGYLSLAIISAVEMRFYMKKNSFIDYRAILASPVSPSISLIAPAYNEGLTIVANVRSLLSVHYANYEVILVNDGSKDDSMGKLIAAYQLEPVDFAVNERIVCNEIKGVYKSRNIAFKKLIVVDKVNGGKSDALNAGINISTKSLIACIDVDCVLEQDALLKMVKPFLENPDVIATGGVIRIANSCEIQDGRMINVEVPDKFLPRVQVMEYIRAFLLGRIAWSKVNGLLLISGAFGLFDKEVVIKAGGYNHHTVGEDMELVVRMRRYMAEINQKAVVAYIPDPLCWTEAPETIKIFGRQRNRWTRGTAETLWLHKKMFFNPRFGIIGMISYPYWLFFEWMAPFVEASGLLYFILLALLGYANWPFFFTLLGVVYSFAVTYSMIAILAEELTYHQYNKKEHIRKLVFTALFEPFFYHPLTVWYALQGNFDLIMGKSSWGEMVRKGFDTVKETGKAVTDSLVGDSLDNKS